MLFKKKITICILISLFTIMMLFNQTAFAISPVNVEKVSRVTGATPTGETIPNPNDTHSNYAVYGTDLGIVWDCGGGKTMVVFGDTFGSTWIGDGGGGGDWRSNVLGISSDSNISNGLRFDSMIVDTAAHAKEIISSQKDTSGNGEFTTIPTAGITVGTRHYIHYMSIKQWGTPGEWDTNFSEIAYSDNNGQTWTKSGTQWSASSNFAQAAYIIDSSYLYMFGTQSGRSGDCYLARVSTSNILTKSSYQYWNGSGWSTNNEAAAAVLVDGGVGELSVAYNSYYEKYIMAYLGEEDLVIRFADNLTGPWSEEKLLASHEDFPGLYGAFIHPFENDGTDLYFLMSQWTPYNVFLMHADLRESLVDDGGFEDQTTSSISSPWSGNGNGGIDLNLGYSYAGENNAFLRNTTGWNDIYQTISVSAYTDYVLTAYVKTSSGQTGGYFGVRDGGGVIEETTYSNLSDYTRLTVSFNSGNRTSLDVFVGFWGNDSDNWVQIDEVDLLDATPYDVQLVDDTGFEEQPENSVGSPWALGGNGGIDQDLGYGHTGENNAWLRNTTGWNNIYQTVDVVPYTSYTLTGYIKSSSNQTGGYFGVRDSGGVIQETTFSDVSSYTQFTVNFNSGNRTQLDVFIGFWGNDEDAWVQVDDVEIK